jgi:dihydroxy-acid dehydratase
MYMSGQDIVHPLAAPLKKDSHLVMLYGNLAPEGAVAKITGKEGERFEGRARVFEGEERATAAILAGRVRAGDVVVIRGEGPRGGPGMREMLSPTSAITGRGLAGDRSRSSRTVASPAAVTASWWDIFLRRPPSGGRSDCCARRPHPHRCGEARAPVELPAAQLRAPAAHGLEAQGPWQQHRGVLAKYAHLVGSASRGSGN